MCNMKNDLKANISGMCKHKSMSFSCGEAVNLSENTAQ